ncbi:MAG: nucleotidyltransferase family protein [Sphingorhabdus sp.]
MSDAMLLVTALRDPQSVAALDADGWTTLLTMARAEVLIGALAIRLDGQRVPDGVAAILGDAKINSAYQRKAALWEANRAAAALAGYDGRVVLMKGTAYVAANMRAGEGRSIGDLDIMVAEEDLREVEKMLLAAGWEWVKEDEYDDAYYREHMHELPPLIHRTRDRMIDVHHTILPKTARPMPDAKAMSDAAVRLSPFQEGGLEEGLYTFSPEDMFIHSAAHLIADGDLAGGLRNLWDMHCLLTAFTAADAAYWTQLKQRAAHHQLFPAVSRAVRLAQYLYGTDIPADWRGISAADRLFIHRLTARNGRGQQTRKFTRFAFYIRSHLLRMPPLMLAKHLWTKWRKGN